VTTPSMPRPEASSGEGRARLINAAALIVAVMGIVTSVYLVYLTRGQDADSKTLERQNSELQKRISTLEATNKQLSEDLGVAKDDLARRQAGTGTANRLTLRVLTPGTGDKVDRDVDVRFEINGEVPKGFSPVVVVGDSNDKFWSFGKAPMNKIRVTLGAESDHGADFTIFVVVTDQPMEGNTGYSALPRALIQTSVRVTRK
jgi:hypothetical protein